MAYGIQYKFIFQSTNGAETEIRVLKDGYSGTVTQRALGGAPVLRQQNGGGVMGSSLAFTPECLVDGEFSQFYTTDAKEFLVEVYRSNTKIWSGFIVPELYSEPDIAPPYDVNITAADGLGELKRYDYQPLGKVTLHALFTSLLSYTGQSLDINYISALSYSGVSATSFFQNTYIDIDYKAGDSCYDVLKYLLDTFHAQVCYYTGKWLISRENDVTFDGSGNPQYITPAGQSSVYNGGKMAITAMGDGGLWPVDFTSSTVDPALRSIVVRAPWNLVSGLVNSAMSSDTGWTKSSNVNFLTGGGYSLLPDAYISQAVSSQLMSKPLLLTFDAGTYIYRPNNVQKYSTAQVDITFVANSTTWYLVEDDQGGLVWSTTAGLVSYKIENANERASAIENQLTIPVFLDSNGDPVTGTLNIKFTAALNQGLRLYGAWLTVVGEEGYKDILNINNGARGEADEVEIAVGYETSELNTHKRYYAGLLLTSGDALITSLSTGNFTSLDFLSLISRDYARSIALPRLRTDGTLNTPSSFVTRPLVLTYRSADRWIQTFEWDLLNDNFNFSALSLPTGTLSVSDENVIATGSASGSPDKTIGRLTPGSGEEALSVMLTNSAHIFSGGTSAATAATDTTKVVSYKGNTRQTVTVGTITGAPTGMTVSVSNNNSTEPTISIAVTTSLTTDGTLTIPVTIDGISFTLSYSWAIAYKGANGQNGQNGTNGSDGMTTAWVTIYKRQASTPSLPRYNVTYYFANGTISGNLDGWSLLPPDTDSAHNPLWMATALAYGSGAYTSISSWNGPVKYVEDGSAGSSKPMRGPTEYSSSFQYSGMQGAGDFVDLVTYNGDTTKMYYCKLTPPGTGYPPTNTTYWEETTWQDFVATKVLFANYSFVKNLGANAVKIANAGGTVTGGFMPPSTDGNGNTIFWAGGATPSAAKFTIDSEGNINAGGGTFAGRLVLPFVDMSSDKTLGTTNSSTYINASSIRILCRITTSGPGYVLTLPNSTDFNGWLLNVYVERRLSRSEMAGEIDGSILIPEKASYGVMAYYASRIIPEYGGYFSFVCVAGQWVLTSYNAASVTFQQ